MVDVGANIGVTSLIMSQVVPDGTVVAIEAGRRNFALLTDNLRANGCANVVPVFAAASRERGTVEFSENTRVWWSCGGAASRRDRLHGRRNQG